MNNRFFAVSIPVSMTQHINSIFLFTFFVHHYCMKHSHDLLQLFMDINKQNAEDKKDHTKNETNTLLILC